MLYNKHVVIFGSNGMLGNTIKLYFKSMNKYDVISLTRKHFDILNTNVEELINLFKVFPDNSIIINATGLIPHSGNTNEDDYIKVNADFPKLLDKLCTEHNHTFIHITTDCVFSGKDGLYNENSIHDEVNDYGVSKSLGELCSGTIIRTSIIGEEVQYKRSLVEWIKSNKDGTINGYINHYWNGVTCLQLAKIIYKIINEDLYWNGIRHIYSPTTVNKYQLCKMINEIFDLNINIKEFNTEKVDKSIISIYDTNSLFNIPELEVQIREMNEL